MFPVWFFGRGLASAAFFMEMREKAVRALRVTQKDFTAKKLLILIKS